MKTYLIFLILFNIETFLYSKNIYSKTIYTMNTYVSIYVFDEELKAFSAIENAALKIEELVSIFNKNNKNGPVYQFNHFNTPIKNKQILQLVNDARNISVISDGYFDITVEPLIKLWKKANKNKTLPKKNEIESILKNVNYNFLKVRDTSLYKENENVQIDFGGIAKGFIILEAIKELKNNNINSALIDAGGDIYTMGKNNGKLWKVGIKSPFDKKTVGHLEVTDLAVVGSGDYERFYQIDGKKYHHILNPKTGYPSANGIVSITAIHPNPMIADAFATALFSFTAEKAIEIVENIDKLDIIVITKNKQFFYTKNLAEIVQGLKF